MDYLLLGALLKNRWAFGGRKGLCGKKYWEACFYRYAVAGIEEAGGTDGTGKDSPVSHERSPDGNSIIRLRFCGNDVILTF